LAVRVNTCIANSGVFCVRSELLEGGAAMVNRTIGGAWWIEAWRPPKCGYHRRVKPNLDDLSVGALVASLALCSCGNSEFGSPGGCEEDAVFVLASDRSASGVGTAGCAKDVTLQVAADLGTDAQLVDANGMPLVVARGSDVAFLVEQGKASRKLIFPGIVGKGGRNPQGLAIAETGDVWVPFFRDYVLDVYRAPLPGAKVQELELKRSISLSKYDPDGDPEPAMVFSVHTPRGERIGVALERLTWQAEGLVARQSFQRSQIVLFDPVTLLPEEPIITQGRNPFGVPKVWGRSIVMAMVGRVDRDQEQDAGVEVFDGTESRLLISESQLGGSVVEAEIDRDCGFAIVMDASARNRTSLVSFKPSTGSVIQGMSNAIIGPANDYNEGPAGLASREGELWVGSRKRESDGLFRLLRYSVDAGSCAVGTPLAFKLALPVLGLRMLQAKSK
jgi:hypothetical protein